MAATGFLYGDTWDYYLTADRLLKWTTLNINVAIPSTTITVTPLAARNGLAGMRVHLVDSIVAYETYIAKTLAPGDPTTFTSGFAFRYSTVQTTSPLGIMAILDTGLTQCQLVLNIDGTLTVARGHDRNNDATYTMKFPLGTTSVAIQAGVNFYHIKWKVVISSTVGTVDVWVNNVSVLHLTGQNTQRTANTSWNGVAVGNVAGNITFNPIASYTNTDNDYDDLTVWDTDYPGADLIGQALHAQTGNGAFTDYTPNIGTNHGDMVKDVDEDGDATINTSSTIGQIDTYAMENVPVGAIVRAVQSVDVCRKDDAGDRLVANVFRIAGVNYVGPDLAPNQTYIQLLTPYTNSPATSVPFTYTEINAMEAGEKVTG